MLTGIELDRIEEEKHVFSHAWREPHICNYIMEWSLFFPSSGLKRKFLSRFM